MSSTTTAWCPLLTVALSDYSGGLFWGVVCLFVSRTEHHAVPRPLPEHFSHKNVIWRRRRRRRWRAGIIEHIRTPPVLCNCYMTAIFQTVVFLFFFLSSNFTKWRLCVFFFFRDTFVFGAFFCLIHDGTSGDFFSNARSVLSALKRSSGEATFSS